VFIEIADLMRTAKSDRPARRRILTGMSTPDKKPAREPAVSVVAGDARA
jgi:hypothetical protein